MAMMADVMKCLHKCSKCLNNRLSSCVGQRKAHIEKKWCPLTYNGIQRWTTGLFFSRRCFVRGPHGVI